MWYIYWYDKYNMLLIDQQEIEQNLNFCHHNEVNLYDINNILLNLSHEQ